VDYHRYHVAMVDAVLRSSIGRIVEWNGQTLSALSVGYMYDSKDRPYKN